MERPFARVSHTDAVALLQKAPVEFEFPVRWGTDLQSEHERYLVEKEFGGTPLFVTDYPRDIKVGKRFKTAVRVVQLAEQDELGACESACRRLGQGTFSSQVSTVCIPLS